MSFALSCFQASASPRPENSDSDKRNALFGLDAQITIYLFIVEDFNKQLYSKCLQHSGCQRDH
jgi:hypothetical protein